LTLWKLSIVILSFIVDKRVRTASNALFDALAVIDFLIGFPDFVQKELRRKSLLVGTPCLVFLNALFLLNVVGSCHLIIIAIDGYQIVYKGMAYLQIKNMERTVIIPIILIKLNYKSSTIHVICYNSSMSCKFTVW